MITREFVAASSGAGDYLGAVWSAVFAIICLGIAFNVKDAAFRIYEFAVNRGPFGPGFGFSPTFIRVLGAILGVAVSVEFATSVKGILS